MGQIRIYNSGDAETDAYLMALYSRSLKSIDEHIATIEEQRIKNLSVYLYDSESLAKVDTRDLDKVIRALEQYKPTDSNKKAKEFHRKFTIGYGHKSIAECGHVNIYFEGIPAYLAQYLQHSTLYSGIESSTRYIDFTNVNGRESKIVNEFLTPDSFGGDFYLPATGQPEVLGAKIDLYRATLQAHTDRLSCDPMQRPESISDAQWLKACKAKATDIARGFLPIGVLTNVGYSASLKEIAELVFRLPKSLEQGHYFGISNEEIVSGLMKIREHLIQAIKDSGHDIVLRDEVLKCDYDLKDFYLEAITDYSRNVDYGSDSVILNEVDPPLWFSIPSNKILDVENPAVRNKMNRYSFWVNIDFAGFRDIHRHRLLTFTLPKFPEIGQIYYLNEFYGDNEARIAGNSISELEFGTNVFTQVSGNTGSFTYFVRTRCNETVHPSVREVAHEIGKELEWRYLPGQFKMNLGRSFENYTDENKVSIKRGTQDIIENK